MNGPGDDIPTGEPPVEEDVEEAPDPRAGDTAGPPAASDEGVMEALRLKARLDEKRRRLKHQEQP